MDTSVFDFQDYKQYLNAVIRSKPQRGHGFRAKLADAIGCQRAFVSQVLQRNSEFNLEHGEAISRFLEHSEEEAEFFLLLIQRARAGTQSLKKFLDRQIQKILTRRMHLKSRMRVEHELSLEDQVIYHSSWLYGTVRVACSVPGLRTREALTKRLELSPTKVQKALDFLTSRGLLEKRGTEYHTTVGFTHLGSDSALIARYHSSWRTRTLESLEEEREQDLHFSVVYSLSAADAQRIKKVLIDTIAEVQKRVTPSPEETIYSLGLDWYEL